VRDAQLLLLLLLFRPLVVQKLEKKLRNLFESEPYSLLLLLLLLFRAAIAADIDKFMSVIH